MGHSRDTDRIATISSEQTSVATSRHIIAHTYGRLDIYPILGPPGGDDFRLGDAAGDSRMLYICDAGTVSML